MFLPKLVIGCLGHLAPLVEKYGLYCNDVNSIVHIDIPSPPLLLNQNEVERTLDNNTARIICRIVWDVGMRSYVLIVLSSIDYVCVDSNPVRDIERSVKLPTGCYIQVSTIYISIHMLQRKKCNKTLKYLYRCDVLY